MSRTVKSEWVVDYRGASDVGVTEWGARRQSELKRGARSQRNWCPGSLSDFLSQPRWGGERLGPLQDPCAREWKRRQLWGGGLGSTLASE